VSRSGAVGLSVTRSLAIRRSVLLAALLAGAMLPLALPRDASARPVPTIYPGGVPEAPDTIVVEFPARRAPSLLSLRAAGPLSLTGDLAPVPDTTSLVRTQRFGAPGSPTAGSGAATAGAGQAVPSAATPGDAITFSGLKSISIEMGKNRNASLDQSLDLTIRGRVASDVEVAAILSDQRLPFEPDGSSRELEDLDNVTLSVRAPKAEATMGDFFLDGLPGEFGRLSRHLQGVRGTARAGGAQWNVAAASAKGEKQSLEFRGTDGSQGPYELQAHTLGADVNGIVAGSETVWLDGARLKRGAEDDYVMDYGAGTITFTVRHPITGASRIAVDFEAATSRYRRSLYAATTEGGSKDRDSWYATYVSEGDDASHPLGADLSPQDRQVLSQLGDSATTSTPSGIHYEGPNRGSYTWDETDPAKPHWVYLGESHGDYDVSFSSVGAGRGAYADTMGTDGSRFYEYRGENLGSYVPGQPLAVPTNQQLLDVGGAARLFGAMSIEAEGARSGYDQNTLSSRDDANNDGMAGRFVARLDPRSIGVGGLGLGKIRAQVLVRSRDARFESFDRIDPAFEGDRWNQTPTTTSTGEDRQEFSLQYDPVTALSLRGDLGHRSLTGGSSSVRNGAQLDLRSFLTGSMHWEEARNSDAGTGGFRSLEGASLSRDRGWLLPHISATQEHIRGQEGDSVEARWNREVVAGLVVVPLPAFRLRGGYGVREEWAAAPAGGSPTSQRATSWDGGISARSGQAFSVDGGFTHRMAMTNGIATPTDLAQLAVMGGRPGGPVTSELRYDVTQLREAAQIRQLMPVGAGSGSYDAFGNPRLGGGYELVTRTGDPSTRSRATAQFRLDTYPSRAALKPGATRAAWRGFGGSSFLHVETLSTLPLGTLEHAFDPGAYLAAGTTLIGNVTARQTLEFVPPQSRYDLRGEIGFRRDQNGEIDSLDSRKDATDGKLTLRHSLPMRLRATASAAYDWTVQSIRRPDTGTSYESHLRGRGFELEVARELRSSWTVSLLSRQRRDIDITNGGLFDLWSVGPTARYAAGGKLRLDGRTLWGWSSQTGCYAPPGLYVAAPVGNRLDYDFTGEYRVRERISLALTWTGYKAPSGPGFYTGRFELKGSF